jgi:hypothetical protein
MSSDYSTPENHSEEGYLIYPLERDHLCQDNPMVPLSYSSEDISAAVVQFIRRACQNKPTVSQRIILTRYKDFCPLNVGNPEHPQNLDRCFDLFNGLFFNGILFDFCSASFAVRTHDSNRAGQSIMEYDLGDEDSTLGCNIQVFTNTRRYIAKPHLRRLEVYLGILLHEMAHAVLQLYTCICEPFCSQRKGNEAGHGASWQAIAYAAQYAALKLLGLQLDLGREQAMVDDIVEYKEGNFPDAATLRAIICVFSAFGAF